MNEFLRRISFDDSHYQRTLSPPIAASFSVECIPEFVRHRLQTRYDLKFHFNQECWIDGNTEDDVDMLLRTKALFIKAVEQFLFGKTLASLYELEMHLHNQDLEKALVALRIARSHLTGDRYD